jgi:trk system potassium uptake protein TrkA
MAVDIIIAGAGTVGFRLATTLSEKHNVTVIDKNAEALNRLQESIDILPVIGNAEDPLTYQSLLDKDADLFIAITDSDEANIISCLIADEFIKVDKKIIRLRNAFFAKCTIAQKLGITEAVFPIARTAHAVNKSDLLLISIQVEYEAADSLSTAAINSDQITVVGIEREKQFFIPKEDEILKPDDRIYLYGVQKAIRSVCSNVNTKMPKEIKKIVIFGADTLGIEIAKSLVQPGIAVKLIDKNLEQCKIAAEILKDDVSVINSKYGDYRVIKEERLKDANMLIASSKNDEENMIKCIEAKEYGVDKVIAINNDVEHYALMHKLGIVAVRGPKNNAYYSIIEKIGSSSILSSRLFCGGSAVALTRTVHTASDLVGKTVLPYPHDDCLCLCIRDNKIVPFKDSIVVLSDDYIMAFTTATEEEKVKKWIYAL